MCNLIKSDDYAIYEICDQVGINQDTWYDWKNNHPEFVIAIEKADEQRLDTFKKAARSGLLTLLQGKEWEEVITEYTSDKDGKPKIRLQKKTKKIILPNAISVIFALKNTDSSNFKDTHELDHTGGIGIVWNETKNYGSNDKADTGI